MLFVPSVRLSVVIVDTPYGLMIFPSIRSVSLLYVIIDDLPLPSTPTYPKAASLPERS